MVFVPLVLNAFLLFTWFIPAQSSKTQAYLRDIAGSVPGYRNKTSLIIRQVILIIFLLVGILPSVCKKMQHLWHAIEYSNNKIRYACINSAPSFPHGIGRSFYCSSPGPFISLSHHCLCARLTILQDWGQKPCASWVLSTPNTKHGIMNAWWTNACPIPHTLDGENRGYPVQQSPICALSASSIHFPRFRCPIYGLGIGQYVHYGVVLSITWEHAKKAHGTCVWHSQFEAN